MKVYDTDLRVPIILVAPSYAQQESIQLRPAPALVGDLTSLVSGLHEHEGIERPVNSFLLQTLRCGSYHVVGLSVRTGATEPLSGRLGGTVTVGGLFASRPSSEVIWQFLLVCKEALAGWTGGAPTPETVTARLQPAVSLRGSSSLDELSALLLSLAEERFGLGFPDVSALRRLTAMPSRGKARTVLTSSSLERLIDRVASLRYQLPAWGQSENVANAALGALPGYLTALALMLGAFERAPFPTNIVIEAAAISGSLIGIALSGSREWRRSPFGERLAEAASLLLALTWMSALIAHVYISR